jgi:hypothetical protein
LEREERKEEQNGAEESPAFESSSSEKVEKSEFD